MREIMRNIARERMRKHGFQRINKKGRDGKSPFAKNWKKFANYQPRKTLFHHKKRVKGAPVHREMMV